MHTHGLQAGPSTSEGDAWAVEAAFGREAFQQGNDLDIAEASAYGRAVPPAPAVDARAPAVARSKRAEVHAAPRPKTRAAARSSSMGRQVPSSLKYLSQVLTQYACHTYSTSYNMCMCV